MKEEQFVVGDAEFAADGGAGAGRGARGEKIVDDLDRAFHADEALGLGAEKFGDGGDAVGRFEGVADGGAITGVGAEEGGIGAVERGDDFGPAVLGEHVACEEGGGRVGHRIVRVDEIEAVVAGHFSEFHRKREGVVGIFEETVAVDFDRVKMDAGGVDRETERTFVTDEVDLMTAGGEFFAEGGGENAAAADTRVADDTDLERGEVSHDGLETTRGVAEDGERIDDERIGGPEGDGLGDAGPETVEAGAGELQFDVVARGGLGGVGLHGGGPRRDHGGNIDEHR